jgi:hypothetical protein
VYDYLLGITTNCVTDAIRTANKSIRNYNAAFFELKHSAHTYPYSQSPEIKILEEERIILEKGRLARAVDEVLSATNREIWKLYYDYNLSVADIANLKGTTPGAIRTRLCRMHVKVWNKIKHDKIDSTRVQLPRTRKDWLFISGCGYLRGAFPEDHFDFALIHEINCSISSNQFCRNLFINFILSEYKDIFASE